MALGNAKHIVYSDEARQKFSDGVQKLAKAVKVTLGPCGRNVVSKPPFEDSPTITKDGVSVAKEINLPDPYEDMGAQLVKEVASRTSDIAGDGTTTATVYAEAIYLEGLRNVAAGANAMELKRGIDAAVEAVVGELAGMSLDVDDARQLEQVAICSTNHDVNLGGLIAEAMERVGKDGVVTVEEGNSPETETEFVDGLQFKNGFMAPHFINDLASMKVIFNNPLILVKDGRISSAADITAAMNYAVTQNPKRPLLVLADNIDSVALQTLIINKLQGVIESCAVKGPGFGDKAKAMLGDLAVATGGEVYSEELDRCLDERRFDPQYLGTARKVIVDKGSCTIVEGGFDKSHTTEANEVHKARVSARVAQIRTELDGASSAWDKEKLEERIAMISGSIARVYVGAATETEIREKKARVEDALHACRAAVEEGILPGGGVAALRAASRAADSLTHFEGDQKTGTQIVLRALEAPLRQIMENAGLEPAVVLNRVVESDEATFGYDALRGRYGDMIDFGIIVPTKVERVALQNAASIAGLMLTTEAIIVEIPDENKGSDAPIPVR